MRITKALVLIGPLLGNLNASPALPAEHIGIVQNMHLNANIAGRGPCFHMLPPIPNVPGNWACVWKDNPLYNETMLTLLSASARAASCRVVWNQVAGGFPKVILVDCES